MAEYNYTKKYEEYLGQTFGKLTVLEVYKGKWGPRAKCRCECGNEHHAALKNLKDGTTKSCGCLNDLTNRKFNRLLVLEKTEARKDSKIVYKCLCDCGNLTFVASDEIKSGHTRSCGCLALEVRTKHGMVGSREYRTWDKLIDRCCNPNHKAFINYGGRGIVVCEEWRNSFEAFYRDMGPRPEGMTLDRIDVNGNYEQSNCRWATSAEQARNKRTNRLITFKQRTQCLTDWADEIGISLDGLRKRLKKMSIEEALTKPLDKRYSSRYRDECTIHT